MNKNTITLSEFSLKNSCINIYDYRPYTFVSCVWS